MSKINNYNKKQILIRNVFAYLGGIICVLLCVIFAPLYDVFEEFKVTYIDNTLSQIMTRYVFVIVIIAFAIFTICFYLIKIVFLYFQERGTKNLSNKHRKV